MHSNDSLGDVANWGLNGAQAARYHSRLSRMHADQSQRFAAKVTRLAIVAGVLCGLSITLAAIGSVLA